MEEKQPEPDSGKPPKANKAKHNKLIMWLLAALALILLGLAGYFWMQLQECKDSEEQLKKDKQQLQEQIDELNKISTAEPAEADGEEVCNDTPTTGMKDNIKAALDTENTAAFATYTTNPVKYVLAASEYGGDISPDEAAISLEYTHSATGPWDFNLPPATLAGFDAGFYTDYFDANTYVGRSTDDMVVAFDFDCNGKIKQIFVAANADLL